MKITITITDLDILELMKVSAALGPNRTIQIDAQPAPAAPPEPTTSSAPAPITAPVATPVAAAAPAAREPGGDDDVPIQKEGDQVFSRCTTVKEVVKEILRRGVQEEAAILAEVQRLQAAGVPVLKPVAAAMLPDKVNVILSALGVV